MGDEAALHIVLFLSGAALSSALFFVVTRRLRKARLIAAEKRERAESALRSIVEGTAVPTGEEFFFSLARHLAEAIDVRYAIVGETTSHNTVRTLAVWAGDHFEENIEYALEGTPCEDVVSQSTCYVQRNVQALFPEDDLLVEMEAESYLGTPLIDADGHTLGLLAVLNDQPLADAELARDLLEIFAGRAASELARNRSEKRRAETELQLQQLQKMNAIGQLAGGVAHDFNNLLQVIVGHLELAIEEIGTRDTIRGDLEHAQAAADRASAVTRQLLAFSRQQVLDPVPLDLSEVVTEMMKMLRRLIGEDIELEVQHDRNLPTVLADRTQMEQVLMNLVVNARDAMPMGGSMIIATADFSIDAAFRNSHPWATHDRYVRVRISDTGRGMDEKTLSQVFEPFFTTKGPHQGTGLGLATVYGIVQQHGGMVVAYSRLGVGTTMEVYLPAAIAGSPVTKESESETPETRGKETVLLAEDEPSLLALISRIMAHAGYTVHSASNGEEAISLYESHRDEISLAVLDVTMPKLGGPEVLEHIRRTRPDLPALFLSGHPAGASRTGVPLDPSDQVLQKPFSSADLLSCVRRCLDVSVPSPSLQEDTPQPR